MFIHKIRPYLKGMALALTELQRGKQDKYKPVNKRLI